MNIPVIIAARNEADAIGITLDSLSYQHADIEPIVIANGCNDDTAEIAADHGATVLHSREGKMLAEQEAFRYLGERALNPLLILDADCTPLSRNWAKRMVGAIQTIPEPTPAVGWGHARLANGTDKFTDIIRTASLARKHIVDRRKETPRYVLGANMVIRMQTQQTLEAILSLPNYWPSEDFAIHDTIIANGGVRRQIVGFRATVRTESARLPSIWERLRRGEASAGRANYQNYLNDAPPGSIPYTKKGVIG